MQKESNITIKFYLNLDKGNGELYPLYCRVTVFGKNTQKTKSEMSFNRKLKFSDWNDSKEEPKKDSLLTEEIARTKTQLFRIKRDFEDQRKIYTAKDILNVYKGVNTVSDFILICFQNHIDRIIKRKEHKDVTIAKYIRTKERLRAFIKTKFNLEDIPIEKITYEFISNWEDYLLAQKATAKQTTLHRNTVNNHHDCLKSVLAELQREGRIRISPYGQFSYKDERQDKQPLSMEQLKRIIKLDVSEFPRLDKVKDIFLFSCFTGLRFSDAMNLEANSIQKIGLDLYEITVRQKKTEGLVSLPLFDTPYAIFRKYDNEERMITGKVLPRVTNQKLNAYLKEIADLSKVHYNAPLTHHVARHTFATTICIENGISKDVLGKWLGHQKRETTDVYAKIQNPYLRERGEELKNKINAKYNEKENSNQ